MSTFTIDVDNNIAAHPSAEEANRGDAAAVIFESQAALAKVAARWPLSRLVEVWNGIPGQSPVKKFQDRKKAVARVWNAIQPLAANVQSTDGAAKNLAIRPLAGKKPKKTKSARKLPQNRVDERAAERSNKKAEVIAMMKRIKGATLAEIMESTGWQQHTVRGFVSILGSKGGQNIESSKNSAGERTYKIASSGRLA